MIPVLSLIISWALSVPSERKTPSYWRNNALHFKETQKVKLLKGRKGYGVDE